MKLKKDRSNAFDPQSQFLRPTDWQDGAHVSFTRRRRRRATTEGRQACQHKDS